MVCPSEQEGSKAASEKSVAEILAALQPKMETITRGSFKSHGMYGCALRASLAKAFEFASLSNQEEPLAHGFFITATLRGICEDLIVFSFLEQFSSVEKNKVMSLLTRINITEALEAQKVFFEENRPWQPVVKPNIGQESDTSLQLRALSKKAGWEGKRPWPSVWFMAKYSGLDAIYKYLYSATSKWVHFSPHILLRMGWGGEQESLESIGDHTEWAFTAMNFQNYYKEFNEIYSIFLLLKLLRGPARRLLPLKAVENLSELESSLTKPLRWPELVTYEELNLRGPNPLLRFALKFAHESKLGESSS